VKIGPVDTNKEKSMVVTGIVDSLYSSGVYDFVFILKDNSNIYYINRALENGIDLQRFNNDLIGEEITLWHAKSRASNGGHMMHLKHKDSIYYTE
tara:strand:- start:15885 stop:16169 length:285 start_codon:yes stop_codon:yes gene_type:complete